GRAGDLVDELRAALEPRPEPAAEPAAEERVTNAGEEAPARRRLPGLPNPWEAALARFRRSPTAANPAGDRPTQAFGDAARRRAMALGRDVAVVAAVGGAFLLAGAGVGGWIIGSSQADASGAEARGYEQGQESGRKAGFAAGKREGLQQGRAAGIKTGKAQGRKAGFAAGRNKGEEEGRASGYSSGYAEGRSTALGGLSPGGWYVLQVGSDGNGPVVSGATPVARGSCYALNGDTVLSGPC
ncbi:MAG TPA: hypothetical protein VK904_00540, partial [Miltoncostaeaceae bacterium]|nr:hypothetical protein [Miltoncostaeaceae bacterium]